MPIGAPERGPIRSRGQGAAALARGVVHPTDEQRRERDELRGGLPPGFAEELERLAFGMAGRADEERLGARASERRDLIRRLAARMLDACCRRRAKGAVVTLFAPVPLR